MDEHDPRTTTPEAEIEKLRAEISELRKQMSAMAVAMVELATKTPQITYYPYTPLPPAQPYVYPYQYWPNTWITCGTGTVSSTAQASGGNWTVINTAGALAA